MAAGRPERQQRALAQQLKANEPLLGPTEICRRLGLDPKRHKGKVCQWLQAMDLDPDVVKKAREEQAVAWQEEAGRTLREMAIDARNVSRAVADLAAENKLKPDETLRALHDIAGAFAYMARPLVEPGQSQPSQNQVNIFPGGGENPLKALMQRGTGGVARSTPGTPPEKVN